MIHNQEGGEVILVSPTLRDLARATTVGMSDADVLEKTGLSFASWRRLWRGEVLSDPLLMQFALGLEVDVEEVLAAARAVRPSWSHRQLMEHVLGNAPIDQAARTEIMRLYLQREREAEQSQDNSKAA